MPHFFFTSLSGKPSLLLFAGTVLCVTGCCDNKHPASREKGGASSTRGNIEPEPRPVIIRPAFPPVMSVSSPRIWPKNPVPGFLYSHKLPREVAVPAGVTLLSLNRPVICSDPDPLGDPNYVTDGIKDGDDGCYLDLCDGQQWVQIDLGESKEIHLIWVWHFHKFETFYNDVIIRLSDDPEFRKGTTVFNNDADGSGGFGKGMDHVWEESNQGRPIQVDGIKGRYVRLYSNGKEIDDTNQYTEVEIYGR